MEKILANFGIKYGPSVDPSLRALSAFIPAFLAAGAITTLSAIPGHNLPSPGLIQDLLYRFHLSFGPDKVFHFINFGVFAWFLMRGFLNSGVFLRKDAAAVATIACTFALGLVDEIHQLSTPGRSADPWDVVADTVGGAAAAAITLAYISARLALPKLRQWYHRPTLASISVHPVPAMRTSALR